MHRGTKLVFEDRGSGRPAFVFVHGWWACDRSFFAPQAEHFVRRPRVVSLNLRGQCESEKPPGRYPIAAHAEHIAYIIEELGLGKTVAVGHSMGGMIVLQLAAAHPDGVAAIVMVDSTLVFSPERRAAFEAVAVGIEAGDHGSRTQFIKSMFIPTSDQRLVENVTAVMLAAPPHIAAAAIRGALEFDCQAAAALCKAPALHLAAIPAAHAATVDNGAAAEPHQRLHRRCRHFNQLEVPDRRMR